MAGGARYREQQSASRDKVLVSEEDLVVVRSGCTRR